MQTGLAAGGLQKYKIPAVALFATVILAILAGLLLNKEPDLMSRAEPHLAGKQYTELKQLVDNKVHFLFLDWKRTVRHLIPLLGKKINIYTPGRSISPFPPRRSNYDATTGPSVPMPILVTVRSTRSFTHWNG